MTVTIPPPVHPDRAAMIRQILEWPDDDAPRLVFADFLDEQGEHERAEFIREMIEECTIYSPAPSHGWFSLWGNPFLVPADVEKVIVRRGFISEICLHCSAFMQYAASIFAAHPVTRVVLVDKRPNDYGPPEDSLRFGWLSIYEQALVTVTLPRPILARLPFGGNSEYSGRWPTESAALDALSLACVQYGRELAGLRPLSA